MRILQVSSAVQFGGGETHLTELIRILRDEGHDVVVAGRKKSAIRPDIELPFLNSADMLTALRLRRILAADRFDVVHAHVARDYGVTAAAAWKVPVAVAATRHLLFPVRRHFLYKRIDGWIAPTRQILTSLAPLAPKNAAVIPNWVDLARLPYAPHRPHDPVVLGLLGQVSPHKGHDDAVEALRILGSGYRLSIAGKGDAAYIDALRSRSGSLPVEFAGFVSQPEFFRDIDILLVPSWEEPFGIVLLEAMAAGVPVVATDAGGPREILRAGIDGILVPPRDPAALAEGVRLAQLREGSTVPEARRRVEKEFDILKVAPRVAGFYERLRRGGPAVSGTRGS